MSLDNWDRAHLPKLAGALFGGGPPPAPGPWEAAIRLGCQALVQAPEDLQSLHLAGRPSSVAPFGTRLLHLIDRAQAIADAYGLRATVDYERGCPSVTLARR